ncbi:hypothetical protein [Pedobacter nototheniae]|uniref:hypothetical protein n=1 Tax=Pedobacter nototheniae TaxID=2488994 RepID=UPI00103CF054|nr:hypothetical protein [Pedobacter nototheniae]
MKKITTKEDLEKFKVGILERLDMAFNSGLYIRSESTILNTAKFQKLEIRIEIKNTDTSKPGFVSQG